MTGMHYEPERTATYDPEGKYVLCAARSEIAPTALYVMCVEGGDTWVTPCVYDALVVSGADVAEVLDTAVRNADSSEGGRYGRILSLSAVPLDDAIIEYMVADMGETQDYL